MSIQAVAWVLDESRSRGFARLVMISLANHHNAGSGQCNPGQRLIATEAGISPGSVSAQIQKLVELGELVVEEPGGSHRSARYLLTFRSGDERSEGAEYARDGGVTTRGDDPSTRGREPSTRGPEPRGISEPGEPREEPRVELPLVPESGEPVDVPHGTSLDESPRGDPDVVGRAATVADRSAAGRALRATGGRPRRRTARDDVWDAFTAVFGAPASGTSEGSKRGKAVRDVMAAGATAEQVERVSRWQLGRWAGSDDRYVAQHWTQLLRQSGQSRRAEDQGTAGWRDDEPGEIVL